MSAAIITVEGLGKKYRLQHQGRPRYTALRDVLAKSAQALLQGKSPWAGNDSAAEEFWALRGVSFSVQPGEVLGIIGRNGAGKSTLLKILSRITEPTEGEVRFRGRVASLLEVGTGFHPELTGRENIYLNGAILGMSRREMRAKFEEIVAFAEVEKFLETPVKHYSSGMYMRLAFAIAAHLEPEILIVDEVLAVGDAQFQKKCLGKMQDVASGGRTVLFVSHAIEAVQRLCSSVLLLDRGQLLQAGRPADIISAYLQTRREQPSVCDLRKAPRDASGRGQVKFLEVSLQSSSPTAWSLLCGEEIVFVFLLQVQQPLTGIDLGLGLFNYAEVEVVSALSSPEHKIDFQEPGHYQVTFGYPALTLVPGTYSFGIGIRSEMGLEDYLKNAFSLEITPSEYSAQRRIDSFSGCVVPEVSLKVERLPSP